MFEVSSMIYDMSSHASKNIVNHVRNNSFANKEYSLEKETTRTYLENNSLTS